MIHGGWCGHVKGARHFFWLGLCVILQAMGAGSLWAQDAAAKSGASELTVEVIQNSDGDSVFLIKGAVAPVATNKVDVKVWLYSANVNVDPPMLGATKQVKEGLIFKPRFPLQSGTAFNVSVQTDPQRKPDFFKVSTPKIAKELTTIEAVYPSASVLPENTLKFYVEFSSPMRKGDIYEFVKLREVDGSDIELPFLEIEQELWSRDSKRLTLLLDPGRIKRGLKPREEMGPIFESGKRYELVIDGTWPDANGKPLGKEFVKPFDATDVDRDQPDPTKWKITKPVAGTREPVQIEFPQSLDYSMLQRAIQVVDENSKAVEGTLAVSDTERSWAFSPVKQWQQGSYRILIDENLEDNAGNSIGRPFDVDVFEKTESSKAKVVELKFKL